MPDGYTFVLTDIGNAVLNSLLYAKPGYDLLKDFAPVTTVSYSPHMLMTTVKLPVATTQELIAYAKARPGKLNFPSGLGGAPHMAGVLFAQRAGIDWVYVPTKGGASSVAAMMAGEGDAMFLGMLQSLPHVNAGRLKLIAISSEKRLETHPKVPTVAETFSGFVTGSWQGIMAPARTPPELVQKMNARSRAHPQAARCGLVPQFAGHDAGRRQLEGSLQVARRRALAVGEGDQGERVQTGAVEMGRRTPSFRRIRTRA